MIRNITDYDSCREFVADFLEDPYFSDPMLVTDEELRHNLIKSIRQPQNHSVLGIYRQNELIGLFAFLVIKEEQYLEMLVGLSRNPDAYKEMVAHLQHHYPGFKADFVFNPGNHLLKELLESCQAQFEQEQQKMIFRGAIPSIDTRGVELLTEKYYQQYCDIHTKNMYWIGEKIIAAPERFRTFLAIVDDQVVGYLDVTHCFEENEPFDLVVLPAYRQKGFGRKLLVSALKMNQPKTMALLVETDNLPAIHLYESTGFVKVQGQNCLTAQWIIPIDT